jgi:hypothetical protein
MEIFYFSHRENVAFVPIFEMRQIDHFCRCGFGGLFVALGDCGF